MRHVILSTLASAPTSYFVYSSLSFFAPSRKGELSGTWFVQALSGLGRTEHAIRMELFRMERDGELLSRKVGRSKLYRPTPAANAEIEAGTRKIFDKKKARWNGTWTVVQFRFDGRERAKRDRLRSLLGVAGFGSLGDGTFIHPRRPTPAFLSAISSLRGKERSISLFTGATLETGNPSDVVSQCWDLKEIRRIYESFIARYNALSTERRRVPDNLAFAARCAIVFDYLEAAWADPDLPPELLPKNWPAQKAAGMAASLYRKLLPGALRHANAIAAS